jgi:hypothetical protein
MAWHGKYYKGAMKDRRREKRTLADAVNAESRKLLWERNLANQIAHLQSLREFGPNTKQALRIAEKHLSPEVFQRKLTQWLIYDGPGVDF